MGIVSKSEVGVGLYLYAVCMAQRERGREDKCLEKGNAVSLV